MTYRYTIITDDGTTDVVEVPGVVVTPPPDVAVKPAVLSQPLPRTGIDAGLLLLVALSMATMGAATSLLTPKRRRE